MRAKFRKNRLDINTVSEESSCVDLVPYEPEILDPDNFRINSPTIKELRKMEQNQYFCPDQATRQALRQQNELLSLMLNFVFTPESVTIPLNITLES